MKTAESKALLFKGISVFALIAAQAFSCVGFCSIPCALRNPLTRDFDFLPTRIDFSRGFDAGTIQPVESRAMPDSSDIAKIIPSDMKPTTDSGRVASQILDHSLSTWFNSDYVRHTDFGHTAHQVEKSMQADAAFGGAEPDSIKHQIKFSMRATETRADLEYSGLTNAQVTYFIVQDKTNIELREPVPVMGTQLVYSHINSHEDTRQLLSMRWDF